MKNFLKNNVVNNTIMLYLMTFAKMIFPLLTLPYLTRILSIETYGVISYIKSYMVYAQILIDFGFLLSATKNIVNSCNDMDKIGKITGNTIGAKVILSIIGLLIICISSFFIEIIRGNIIYTLLSYSAVVLTIFLPDFLFRGIEKMEIITIRFIIMRGISTLLTFIFIKSDSNLLLIPVLDIIGTFFSIIWTWYEIKKMNIIISFGQLKDMVHCLKESFVFFVSDASTTVFGALNTLLIGIYLNKSDIAFWSVAMQLISAAQSLYPPIINGVYPQMIRSKDLKLIKKIFIIFMPLILVASLFTFIFAKYIIIIISGIKYINAVTIFRYLIPLLIFSFPSMLFGWPVLGAIEKQNETTYTTILSACVQIVMIVILIMTSHFTLINIAISRTFSEIVLMLSRLFFIIKFKNKFN